MQADLNAGLVSMPSAGLERVLKPQMATPLSFSQPLSPGGLTCVVSSNLSCLNKCVQ
jgi:hypothetical protein